jgi:hypothetical protein
MPITFVKLDFDVNARDPEFRLLELINRADARRRNSGAITHKDEIAVWVPVNMV